MGILINEPVEFQNGIINPSGTYLTFNTFFPSNQYKVIINFNFFLNESLSNNNINEMKIKDLNNTLTIEFERDEFLTLDLITIYGKIIDFLSLKYNNENLITSL